ncbi:MAG: ATP-binding protein [Isosphaerales bacterium]
MPEFNRKTLEVLRQPLEEGEVTISRARRSTTFPAGLILVTAMNPYPCSYRSDPRLACSCAPPQLENYLALSRVGFSARLPIIGSSHVNPTPVRP